MVMGGGNSLGTAVLDLSVDDSKFDKGLDRAEGKSRKWAGTVAKVAAGAGLAVAGIGVAALKFAGDFDNAFDTIRAGTGATGKALEGLQDDFRSVVKDVPTDFATAGTAIADLNTRLGTTGEQLQDSAKQFLNLSRVTGTDVSQNIAKATRVFGDWDVAAQDQAATMDALFRATQVSGIGFDQLTSSVVQFGAPLRSMGFTLEESTALLSKWEKEGVNAERILGSLSLAANHFAKEGIDMKEGLATTIEEIENAASSSEALAIAQGVVGSRAANDFQAAIREGRFDLEEYIDAISNGEDTINAVAADTDDWRQKLTLLKNRGLVAAEPALMAFFDGVGRLADFIGTDVVPVLSAMADTFRADILPVIQDDVMPVVQRFTDEVLGALSTTIQEDLLPKLQTFAGFLREDVSPVAQDLGTTLNDHVMPPLQSFGNWLSDHKEVLVSVGVAWAAFTATTQTFAAIRGIQAAFAAMSMGIRGVNASLLAPPGIAILIAAIATALFLVWQNWDSIWPKLQAGWEFMKQKAGELASWVGDKIGDIVQWFQDLPGRIWGAVSDIGSWLVEQGGELIDGLWTGIKDIWESVTGWFGDLPLKVVRAAKTIIAPHLALLQIGKDIITGLWNGMKEIWPRITGWLGEQAAKLPGWITGPLGISSPSKVFADIGEDISEGLGIGLSEGFERFTSPALREIEGKISRFLTDPLGAGGMHGGNLVARLEGQLALGQNVLGNEGIGGELKRFWTRQTNEARDALDTIRGTLDQRRRIEDDFLNQQIEAYLEGGQQAVDVVRQSQEQMRGDLMGVANSLVQTFGISVPTALDHAFRHVGAAMSGLRAQARSLAEATRGLIETAADTSSSGRALASSINGVFQALNAAGAQFDANTVAGLVNATQRDPNASTIGALNDYLRSRGASLPSFGHGGVVPGRLGQPVPILAHGGETVLPTHRRGSGNEYHITVQALDSRGAADAVLDAIVRLERTGRLSGVTA